MKARKDGYNGVTLDGRNEGWIECWPLTNSLMVDGQTDPVKRNSKGTNIT